MDVNTMFPNNVSEEEVYIEKRQSFLIHGKASLCFHIKEGFVWTQVGTYDMVLQD
jgi:hypothetical protein